MSKVNNWYVITGGPSTGKTTLLAELEKLGHSTIPEAARTLIDKALAKGISVAEFRADEKRFQEDVAHLKAEIEATHNTDLLTFFDRGMQDTIAYMRYYGYNIEKKIENYMKNSIYKNVFLLEPLSAYRSDYARTEDHGFTKKMHKLLHDAYSEFGMKPILVPALASAQRANFVLDYIKEDQSK